jgi:phosphoribosylaminoimidazole-succinocarboxamide synthase
MTDEVVAGITDRYIELYEHITGEPFRRADDEDIVGRIEKNVEAFLADEM